MKITRFEDIEAWQESRILVKYVYDAINRSEQFRKDFRLANQIQGAAISVMSNIAEGFSRKGHKEFIQFLFISKSSAAEVQSQLYVALDQKYISKETFETIYNQAEKVAKMNSGFIKYLKSQPNKPNKPK
jgi:four helix bundle protein